MDCQEWYKKYVKRNPAANAKELAWKNRYSDKILFERYLEVLGKDKKNRKPLRLPGIKV